MKKAVYTVDISLMVVVKLL